MPYQLTVRLPNGKGWRLRTTSAAEFRAIAGDMAQTVASRLQLSDLAGLWPDSAADAFHNYCSETFHAVLRSVREQIARGQFDVLQTGRDLLHMILDDMRARGWSETCTKIGKRILKITLQAGLVWLRGQFPVINDRNYPSAITALSRLIQQHGAFI